MNNKQTLLEELRNIYQINKEQLVFAESKNGVLLVFNMAFLGIVLNYENICRPLLTLIIIGIALSSFISFISFAPLTYDSKTIKKIDKENTSIIYFRNIAEYQNSNDYLNKLCQELKLGDLGLDSFEIAKSYAQEIIIIARITNIKNNAFRSSLTITLLVLGLLTIALVLL